MISTSEDRPATSLAAAITMVGVLLPLVTAWFMFGRAPHVSATEAGTWLQEDSTILVAVDPVLSARLPESTVWPLASILQTQGPSQVPDRLQGKRMLLLCKGGIQSARAAIHLRGIGVDRAFSVWGGFQEWITRSSMRTLGQRSRQTQDIAKSIPLFQPSPLHEQLAAFFSFFGIKTIYSILAVILAIMVWREKATDLAALRRSMTAFFIGEGFCFINVMFFGDHNLFFEHLHSVGMVISLAFFAYALLEGLDSRLFHFSDEGRCAAIGLCGACFKHSDVPCGLRRAFLLSVPLLGLAAALPLFSQLRDTAYNTLILGTLYGYRHLVVHQLYELRYLPGVAVVLFASCLFMLLLVERRTVKLSKVLFAAATGAMAFSYFRLLIVAAFIDRQVWFAVWEETSELIYILLAGSVLFLFPRIYPLAGWIMPDRGKESRS